MLNSMMIEIIVVAHLDMVVVSQYTSSTTGDIHKILKKNVMTKKNVGQVTVEEKNEIQGLFERRNGLNELAQILTIDNEMLYQKLVKDLGETGTKFQGWWDRMYEKYQWEKVEGGNWEIDFDTCEIYLVEQ